MTSNLETLFQNKKVVLLGCGISNNGTAKLLQAQGADVTLCDRQTREKLGAACGELEDAGIKLRLGPDYLDALDGADIIFRAPGFYWGSPSLSAARAKGKIVTSETEVFFDLCSCPIYAVTGSDGKTTTATLIAKFLEAQGRKVHLGGNIGTPLLCDIENIQAEDVAVVELSSFQLISMRRSPDVAVMTNLAPNHLDIHQSMEEYVSAKLNILLHQNAFSKAVLNWDNALTRSFAALVRGKLAAFSRETVPDRGAYLREDGTICMSEEGNTRELFHRDEIRLPGIHNAENYLAAITAVWPEVSLENLRKEAGSFGGVEHRLELAREAGGVRWYNDSKATTPGSTLACLNSFPQKIILIAGGYDKKVSFAPLAPKIVERVKALILMGDTAGLIEAAVRDCEKFDPDILPIFRAGSMEEAVDFAQKAAEPGDVVALSPASASFGMYKNFEARGRHFKEILNSLH